MLLQLGTYKFEGLKLPQSWGSSFETNYAQIGIVNGKPIVQKVGEKLIETDLDIFFSIEFCTPLNEIDNLNASRKAGEVLQLIDGTGRNYGKYVIVSLSVDNIQTLEDGTPTGISASLKLLEYNAQTATVRTGAALKNSLPTAQPVKLPLKSVGIQIMDSVKVVDLKTLAIAKNIKPTTSLGMLKKIKQDAATVKSAIDDVKTKVDNTRKIVTRVQTEIQSNITAIQIFSQSIQDTVGSIGQTMTQAQAITRIQTYSNTLTGEMDKLKRSAAPIVAFIGSREGGE